MSAVVVHLACIIGLALVGLALMLRSRMRTARDVAADLADEAAGCAAESGLRLRGGGGQGGGGVPTPAAIKLGILDGHGLMQQQLHKKVWPIYGACAGAAAHLSCLPGATRGLSVCCLMGAAFGYLAAARHERARRDGFVRALEYHLPVVMERLVMGVEAGLDILSACSTIIQLEKEEAQMQGGTGPEPNPATRLLEVVLRLTESGRGFEESLRRTAGMIECGPIKHAFVHLALAHKEGGELIVPLRELSDSTQLAYQETVEEEIAKLPVKATMPLLCTFAGLVVCFLTSPVIQVVKILTQASIK